MPADFKKETIDKYDALNRQYKDSRVIETYGNITVDNCFESGRPVDILPGADLGILSSYIRYSKDRDIDFNYTVNASYMQNREFSREGISEILDFLGRLYDAGVRTLTVTLPSLMELINLSGYDFKIKASTICQVTNVNKALELQRWGVERIVTEESINRRFGTLKQIVEALGKSVEIIVNSICHIDCNYRMFHYNQISGNSRQVMEENINDYYPHRCLLKRYEKPGNILKLSWIRPEDLKYYRAVGVNHFKLQGRPRVLKGDPIRAVEAYFKEDYEGDLLELLNLFASVGSFKVPIDNKKLAGFIKPYSQKDDFCGHNCLCCGYCEAYAKKIMNPRQAEEIHCLAVEFYSKLDPIKKNFEKVMKSAIKPCKLVAEDTLHDDGEFEL
jgi:collagenase-like PrtC family protease